jgi:hypothetical protein
MLAVLAAAEIALAFGAPPASAQWWGSWQQRQQSPYRSPSPYQQNPYQNQNSFPFFQSQPERPPPVDYSKAPAPRNKENKEEGTAQTNIVVFGDSMADWLAYGLETAFAEQPEMGVLRRHKTWSGLIRQEVRRDPRGEHPDWPKAAREMLASLKPDFIIMMIGINDRRSIREPRAAPRPAAPKPAQPGESAAEQKPEQKADQKADPKADQKTAHTEPPDDEQSPAEAPASEPEPSGPGRSHEFRSEKWAELYIKRIDDTIAALKSKGVPVFWVGLPPIRGTRSMADMSYLNDLYRSRADKAGIVYVDVWDGFVDEAGRFSLQGPDVEGQIRRLRTSDGVYFSQPGARKLAHFVDRELQRWLTARVTPVALPAPEEPAPKGPEAARPGAGGTPRPLAGPVIPLTAGREGGDELLGGGNTRQTATSDAIASKVLVKGEPMPAPAGRADDFAWPRRGVAPVGTDPVAVTATLPMTPMQAEKPSEPTLAQQGPPAPRTAAIRPPGPRPPSQAQSQYRPRSQPFFFPFLFGR